MYKYIAFNKPYGVLCQFTSETGVRNLSEFNLPPDVYPVGRLDKDSEGLLLLSDDGRFIDRVLHPKFEKTKSYLVQVDGDPSNMAIKDLEAGPIIKGHKCKKCSVQKLADFDLPPREPPIRVRKNIPTTWLRITITEGKNRQVRRMTAAVGHPTLRLIRESIGSFTMANLAPGQWININKSDI